ncbi:MAG: amidase [Acidobacteriota bacterium]
MDRVERSENHCGAVGRRSILKVLSAAGVGSAVFGRAVVALAADKAPITAKMLQQAEWISGLTLSDEKRKMMLDGLSEAAGDYTRLRAVTIDNSVPPAVQFAADPFQAHGQPAGRGRVVPIETSPGRLPASPEDLAFARVHELGPLIRDRQISSRELTRLYLDRLATYDPVLRCVITLTRDLALAQADRADRAIAAGEYRGPLHGIPWGAKDLLSVPGYRTTWGAAPYKDQQRPETATAARRLEDAGAVLVAKTSLGALAWGDVWFDATTKNPWNKEQGSSGSSAGSASATAAGLVGFALGTETLGSIVSPSTRCGATGLRPTFGRVSRHGAMALSWSMDKIGPITRSVEDCALVFSALHGADGLDPAAVDRPFSWPFRRDIRTLRVGYVPDLFEDTRAEGIEDEEARERFLEWREFDRRTLKELEGLGLDLVPIELPSTYPVDALGLILTAEAATAFDELTRSGKDDLLTRQIENAWPNVFRLGQMIPAVEYLRANRIRHLVMREMEDLMKQVDLYVTPSFGGVNLLLTNLTGHPQVVLPNGFRASDGTPTSITFTGRLYGETELLAVAHAYQEATGFHLRRPPMETLKTS